MDLSSFKVVVVEDDPVVSWHLNRILQKWSCSAVVSFESKKEVIEYLRYERADLIITNLRLLDGWINLDYFYRLGVKVDQFLILTGLRNEQLQTLLTDLIKPTFLYKPFSPKQLKKCIESLFLNNNTTRRSF